MAFAMTAPMVALMLYRGHSRRSTAEMAVAMMALGAAARRWNVGQVITARGRPHMSASLVAMIVALIVYRRREYRMAAAAHA